MTNMHDEINGKNEAIEVNLENGTYTHLGLMEGKSKIGNSVIFVIAYDFDKNWQAIDSVHSSDGLDKKLDDYASKYNLISEGLIVDEKFDPVSASFQPDVPRMTLGDINLLNFDSDLVDKFKDIENSFGVERDIKSGSMLAPDKERLIEILKMRKEVLEGVTERGHIDSMLALEKVFVDGEKNPLAINRMKRAIGSFFYAFQFDKADYVVKVEKSQAKGVWMNSEIDGLPMDDTSRDLTGHHLRLHDRASRILNVDEAKIDNLDVQLAKLESSILIERADRIINVLSSYKYIQKDILHLDPYVKEAVKTKEAGAEIGM